jgi:alkylated DNA repair protein alkB family protein 4
VRVYLNFISEDEERKLVEDIDKGEWLPSQSGRFKQDYGPRANYKRKKLKLDKFQGLPKYSQYIRNRLAEGEIYELSDFIPVEQCNLDYRPELGSSIDFHFDDFWLWGERLIILNVLSDSYMLFNNNEKYVKVPLPQRSLIVMSGDGRTVWKHAIAREDILSRRISVTFRELSEEFLVGERSLEGQKIIELASVLV